MQWGLKEVAMNLTPGYLGKWNEYCQDFRIGISSGLYVETEFEVLLVSNFYHFHVSL